MAICYTSNAPRKCCCGCSIECWVWTFTILCTIDATFRLFSAYWYTAFGSLIPAVLGFWTLVSKDNMTARVINYYVWLVIGGLGALGLLTWTVGGYWIV